MIQKLFIGLLFSIASMGLKAELVIEVTDWVQNPTPVAVVPFGGAQGLPENISQIVENDLRRSGLFRPIPQRDMLSLPTRQSDIFYRDWRLLGAKYLIIGQLQVVAGEHTLKYQLFDVLSQKLVVSNSWKSSVSGLRDLAHRVSDDVYEAITGIRGAFSTKILYVEDLKKPGSGRYRLVKADADGAREHVILASKDPILSPSWSNDLKQVAYVSFETSRPAIFRQNIATGQREQLTNFKGLNGAPAWSPDNSKLAMVLSKDGNPEIYILEIATKKFTRVTSHFAIDTEPNWNSDGSGIIFTSNRGGSPQIYQVTLASGRVERLTFEGNYNARPRISPDGKSMVMVHRHNDVFHIAWQDLVSGDIRILTETHLDESPSIAPNGAMLLYATRHQGKGVLAAVSMDAGVKFRLPSKKGDVREPAWSPFPI